MWFRLEYVDGISSSRTQLTYFDMGIGTNWEATVRTQQIDYGPSVATLDLIYNYISPIPGLSPGLAAGVQDVLNKAQDGRRPFVCATWSEPGQAMGGEVMDDITLGIYYRSRPYGFVGTSIRAQRRPALRRL